MDVVQVVRAAFSREAIPALSRMLEEPPKKVQAAVGASIPTTMLLLSGKASHPAGAEQVLAIVNERGPAVMDHVAQQVRDGDAQLHSAVGMRRLNRLLGRDSAEGLAYAVSRFSGLSLGSSRVVVGLAGLACLEAVGRHVSPRDVPGISSYLAQKQTAFSNAVPAGMYEYLEAVPPLRALAHQYDRAQPSEPSASTDDAMRGESAFPRQENYANEQYYEMDQEKERAPAAMAWAIPILIVLAIGAAMLFTLYPRNANNPVSMAPPAKETQNASAESAGAAQAQPAASQLPGAPGPFGLSDMAYLSNEPLRKDLTGAFGRLASALGSVRDVQTAANANAELNQVSQDLRQAQPTIATLPADTQTRLSEEIQHALPSITEAVKTASTQPGGQAIQPTAQQILRQIQEITRNRQS